jgi:hypothetical protein
VHETAVPVAGSRLAVLSASGGGEISGSAASGGGLFSDDREQTPQLTTGRYVGDGGDFVVASFKGKR